MYGWKGILTETKICKICGKPFETYIELGAEKFPVWLHDYPTLKSCKAIVFAQNFAQQLQRQREMINEGFLKGWEVHGPKLAEASGRSR